MQQRECIIACEGWSTRPLVDEEIVLVTTEYFDHLGTLLVTLAFQHALAAKQLLPGHIPAESFDQHSLSVLAIGRSIEGTLRTLRDPLQRLVFRKHKFIHIRFSKQKL